MNKTIRNDTIDPAAPVETSHRLLGTFPTAPLLLPAAGIISGILLSAGGWRFPPLMVAAAGLTAIYLFLATRTRNAAPPGPSRGGRRAIGECAVLSVAVAAGATLHAAASAEGTLAQMAANGSPLVRIRGVVTETPRLIPRSDALLAKFSFHTEQSVMTVRAEEIGTGAGWVRANGLLRATLREVVLDIEAGDRVELLGFLRPLRHPSNPGAFDWATYLKRRGIEADLLCASSGNVRITARSSRDDSRLGLRDKLLERARALLLPSAAASAEHGRLIDALILGQRSRAGRALSESFARAGASHFLAVSGMHVGILGGLIWLVCRTLGVRPARSAGAVILITILYALLAEPRPPVLRAAVMTTIFCCGIALRRRSAPLNSLAAAAIVLLVWRPLDLFDVGFQLSFVAVLGILLIGVPAAQRVGAALSATRRDAKTSKGKRYRRIRRMTPQWFRLAASWSASALFVSIAAWASTIPISLATFHEWHPYAPLIALFLMPVVGVLLAAGLTALTLGAVAPPIAYLCSLIARRTEGLLLALVESLGTLPGTTIVSGSPPLYWTLLYYLSLAGVAAGLRARAPHSRAARPREQDEPHAPRPNRPASAAIGASILLAIGVSLAWHFDRADDDLRATFLAVGDGSAAVIELPSGEVLLIDAGSLTSPSVGRTTVAAFLQSRGIHRIDEIIISHANLDHYGGVPEVIDAVEVGRVTVTQQFLDHAETHRASRALMEFVRGAGVPVGVVTPPAHEERGDVRIEHLWPPPSLKDISANDSSLVTRISMGERRILFTGDIEEQAIANILGDERIRADVLVLPHHGQVVPSTPTLLAATGADVLIRSTNRRRADTTSGLFDLAGDRPLLSTADVGAVCVTLSGAEARATPCLAE